MGKLNRHSGQTRELQKDNYGQVYIRKDDINKLYQTLLDNKITIHPNGHLAKKSFLSKTGI